MLLKKLALKWKLKRREMELEERLKNFGLPVDKLLTPLNDIDDNAPYTVVNISEATVIIPQTLPSGNVKTATLNPFGFTGCAATLPGSVVQDLDVRQFWQKGYIAVLSGKIDTSFLLNCVPLGTENPYSKHFFDKNELSYSSPADQISDPGVTIDPEKIEAIAKPLADKLQTATKGGRGHKGSGVPISGEFHPENIDK